MTRRPGSLEEDEDAVGFAVGEGGGAGVTGEGGGVGGGGLS